MTTTPPQSTGPPAEFEPPGPGFWELETSHHGLRPLSPFLRESYRSGFETGIAAMLARYGLPLAAIRTALVQGCFYVRPEGVGEGSKPKPPPPVPIMKLVVRLHPEMRRRARTAKQAFAERRWRSEVDRWFDHDRSVVEARNLDLQRVDLVPLDDAALAAYVADCLRHFAEGMRRNLDTHGGDLIPVGDLMAHCETWGIDAATSSALLGGCSPATIETAVLLRPVAAALAERGPTKPSPASIDEVRALGPEARDAVDTWLERHAWRLVTSDDIDRPTLAELPALQLQALLAATDPDVEPADPRPVRSRVPADQRATFDALLEEARYGHRQRDDIRGLCWNWPGGLVRRALLEAGRRLVGAGKVYEVEHVAECSPSELDGLLHGDGPPTADELAIRAEHRDRIEATPPPHFLGEPEEPPPLAALPAAMARATAALMTNLGADGAAPQTEALHGTGIGEAPYRGRACVVHDVGDAVTRLEPGDVLVAAFTGPSFNSIMPIVGALVVEQGGPMCHAAIVARDFGVPALVGTLGAMHDIPNGAPVEVDPGAGVVRLL
jgi:rifampicin phosphotransferase